MITPGEIPPPYNQEDSYQTPSSPGQTGPAFEQANSVYQQAFGYVRPPYPGLILGTTFPVRPRGSFNYRSKLGTEYTYPTKLAGWQIPQEPTISTTGGKRIVETELNRGKNRVQNVIEEVNLNNYRIRMRGVILNEDEFDIYPEAAILQLRSILEKAGSITIENDLLRMWNINLVVIRDWDMFEVKGYAGAQAFEIEMLSDQNYDLELSDAPERL